MLTLRGTKIVATLGPASRTPEILHRLCEAGVNVFRLNFSHGTHEDHRQAVDLIRQEERAIGHPLAIMLDLQGPKLRIGTFANGKELLQIGQKFQLDLNPAPGDSSRVYFGHETVLRSLQPGTHILVDDGKVLLVVEEAASGADARVVCTVQSGYEISDHKGVNLPNLVLPIDAMTPKDEEDLAFGLQLGVDWIALSFVQSAADILRAREKTPATVKIVAKLEKPQAIQNLDAILEASDGIMVARGDLGVEVPLERVPGLQKRILRACHLRGKPVIVATQMLDSMVTAPTPTRAEVSDVANAVYDGADAVMLSAESASGKHPVEAVQIMDRIIRQVEKDRSYLDTLRASLPFVPEVCSPVTSAAPAIAEQSKAAVIATVSVNGLTALRISRERPFCPIVTFSNDEHTARFLCLVWGVYPQHVPSNEGAAPQEATLEEWIARIRETLLNEKIAKTGDEALLVAGYPFGLGNRSNFASLIEI